MQRCKAQGELNGRLHRSGDPLAPVTAVVIAVRQVEDHIISKLKPNMHRVFFLMVSGRWEPGHLKSSWLFSFAGVRQGEGLALRVRTERIGLLPRTLLNFHSVEGFP